MSDRYFLDTNIFIYAVDPADPAKQEAARDLIRQALGDLEGVVSWQVVQEFCNAATRKIAVPVSLSDCREYLTDVLGPLCVIFPRIQLFQEALRLQDETGYGFYDCLIIASALDGQCNTLYSEDMQHGQQIRGLTIVNPFV